jgi:hypothetical protein
MIPWWHQKFDLLDQMGIYINKMPESFNKTYTTTKGVLVHQMISLDFE